MSWGRFDDLFTEWPEWDGVSYPARWHYMGLVGKCSRSQRWDGRLPLKTARRASDVDDPDACHAELAEVGLLRLMDGAVVVVRIDQHVPPAYIRENSEKSKIRMRRNRAHKKGDHSLCLPENCPGAVAPDAVTGFVTRNTGTGQDRTGQASTATTNPPSKTGPVWPEAAIPGKPKKPPAADEISEGQMSIGIP